MEIGFSTLSTPCNGFLRRNIVLHYAKHACENVVVKYAISRGTCVKAIWDKAVENDYYVKNFDVREVK